MVIFTIINKKKTDTMDLYSFDKYTSLEALNERYSHLANILRGARRSVISVGILTAENPHGKQLSAEENRKRMEDLVDLLTEGRFGWRWSLGKYGNLENTLIISNISRDDAMALGGIFDQDTVIWGKRVEESDYIGMDFQLIGTDKHNWGEIVGENRLMVGRENAKDFYTEYKGKKFVIPFFGTEDTVSLLDGWKKTISRDYSGSAWRGGEAPPTKVVTRWRNEEFGVELSDEDWEKLQNYVKLGSERSGSSSWNYRGMAKKLLADNKITN